MNVEKFQKSDAKCPFSIAIKSDESELIVSDNECLKSISVLTGHSIVKYDKILETAVLAITLSKDDRYVIFTDFEGFIRVYNMKFGTLEKTKAIFNHRITSIIN